ncbi:MAG: hypothetical protein WB807_01845 [Candidatus Dormiibacterota bacterium]
MTRNRAALAIPAALVMLSGCGVAAAVTARTTTVSDLNANGAAADASPHVHAISQPAVVPTPATVPAASHPIPPAHTANGDVVAILTAGATQWLEILSHSGVVVAKTTINPILGWMVNAGPGGAYWSQSGAEHELTTSGAVRTLGPVPGDANGVVISPDGTSYAYSTSDQSNAGNLNRIVVVHPGGSTTTIADRFDNPNVQTADAPEGWQYYLISWTSPGIAFARVPTGGCGCGSFDMQMQSAYSATINPVTEVVTPLTGSWTCPLSAVGPGMQTACFSSDTNGNTVGLRITSGGVLRHNFPMSGVNVGGDAVFSPAGTELAYVTVPSSEATCGATWNATLRILNLATGAAVTRTLGQFSPAVWGADGLLYGSIASQSDTAASLVALNPVTLAVTQISPAIVGQQFVGIM